MEFLAMAIASAFVSVVPALMYLWFIWWLDRYDREPWYLVAGAFAWGALGAVMIAIVVSLGLAAPFHMFMSKQAVFSISIVIIAPLVEEIAKAMILMPLAFHRKFDGLVDGMVYGAIVGLGFAVTENFFYYIGVFAKGGAASWAVTVVLRTFCSTWMHALATGVTGAAIGYAKFASSRNARWFAPPLGLLAAMGVHGFYNGAIALAQAKAIPAIFIVDVIILVVELLLAFFIMQWALHKESQVIHNELVEECELGVITKEQLETVPSYWNRLQQIWKEGASHYFEMQEFFSIATELALRKHEAKLCDGARKERLLEDVEKLRSKLKELQ